MKTSLEGAPAPELSNRLRGKQIPHIGRLSREDLSKKALLALTVK